MLHNQTVMLQNALGFTQLSLMKDFDGQFPQQRPSSHRPGHLHVHPDVIRCALCMWSLRLGLRLCLPMDRHLL